MSMSDSILPESIPSQIRYSTGLKPEAAASRLVRRSFLPEGPASYDNNNRNIRIPISSTSAFLDTSRSYLRFKVSAVMGGTDVAYFTSAYSLFDRLEVLGGGGQVLESINDWGKLTNALANGFMAPGPRTAQGTYQGFARGVGDTIYYSQDGTSKVITEADGVLHTDSSRMTSFTGGGVVTYNFAIPITCSGLFTLSSKAHNADGSGYFLPLPLLSKLTLSLYLRDSLGKIFYGVSPTSFTVSELSFDAALVEFDSSFVQGMKQALAAAGGKTYISSATWMSQRTASSSDVVQPQISVRSRSLKNLLTLVYNSAQDAGAVSTQAPDHTVGGVQEFYALIGNSSFPANRLVGDHAMMAEAENAMGQTFCGITKLSHYAGLSAANTIAATQWSDKKDLPAAIYGVDLEALVPGKAYAEAGLDNTTGGPINTYMRFSSSTPRIITTYVHTDCVFEIDTTIQDIQVSY